MTYRRTCSSYGPQDDSPEDLRLRLPDATYRVQSVTTTPTVAPPSSALFKTRTGGEGSDTSLRRVLLATSSSTVLTHFGMSFRAPELWRLLDTFYDQVRVMLYASLLLGYVYKLSSVSSDMYTERTASHPWRVLASAVSEYALRNLSSKAC